MAVLVLVLCDAPQVFCVLSGPNHVCKSAQNAITKLTCLVASTHSPFLGTTHSKEHEQLQSGTLHRRSDACAGNYEMLFNPPDVLQSLVTSRIYLSASIVTL